MTRNNKIIRACTVTQSTGFFVGLSLSSVEGMCVGKPFLASYVDGLREIVKVARILFPHQDGKDLAESILSIDADTALYNEIANQCFDRVRQYEIAAMCDGYLRMYNSL